MGAIRNCCVMLGVMVITLMETACGGSNPAPVAAAPPPDAAAGNAVNATAASQATSNNVAPEPTPPPVKPNDVQPSTAPITPPVETASANNSTPAASQQPDPKVALFGGLTGPKPATWSWQPANRLSVICEYIVPGRDGLNQGRVTVFRVGGSPEQNILRWKTTQFRGPNQSAVEPKIDQLESDGMAITLAEFTGEFKGTGAVNFSPDHTLLAAIIPDAPGGQIIIYFVGPTGTVEPNREAFMEMIHNLKKVEAEK